ncbi:MAG: SACOL1771 family peroxiredoxin [Rhodanobacter sp.]
MTTHSFHLTATWPGGRNSVGDIHCGALATQISIAPGMDGPGVGTNPDEMLLGAAATCYLITLAAMLERAGIETSALSLDSELTVGVHRSAYVCENIIHRPQVTLASDVAADTLMKVLHLTDIAERRCMISNAMRGNVAIRVEADVRRAT